MDDQRRYFIAGIVGQICETVIKLAAIAAVLCAVRSPARGGDRVTFDPYAPSPAVVSAEARPAETKSVSEIPAAGFHIHRCSAGHEWSHADTSKGDRSAHTCPECGRLSWQPARTGVRLVERSAPPFPPYPSSPYPAVARGNSITISPRVSSCPGGTCPKSR